MCWPGSLMRDNDNGGNNVENVDPSQKGKA
ncbi:hypothetical protein LCGC14_2660210, partial [marine sediment metagenome]